MKFIFFLPVVLLSVQTFAQQQNENIIYKVSSPTSLKKDFGDDWADLHHYAAKNELLPAPAATENRVVFLGSSIFELWKERVPEYFNNRQYIDRGISGQISPQLLIRFQQDVINLQPKAVIILAGSNDIGSSKGHVTNESILNNIQSMVELAQVHHIKVILCAYLPINNYPDKIVELNRQIKAFCAENGLTLLDYFTPLNDGNNKQKPGWTLDGVHPNATGYKIMAKVTDEAIATALK
jgi:lysophospholipase L1-like esterase